MGRSQGVKRTRSLTAASSSKILDSPVANKKRLLEGSSQRAGSAPATAGRKARSKHNLGRNEWNCLSNDWSESSGSHPLVPLPFRLRQLVVPGTKALIDLRTCDQEWYAKRAKRDRKKEEMERLRHEHKVTQKQCSQRQVASAQRALSNAEEELGPLEKELACLTRSLSVPKTVLLAFGQEVLSSLKADNAEDAPRVFRLLLARCLNVKEKDRKSVV